MYEVSLIWAARKGSGWWKKKGKSFDLCEPHSFSLCAGGANDVASRLGLAGKLAGWQALGLQDRSSAVHQRDHVRIASTLAATRQSNVLSTHFSHAAAIVPRALHRRRLPPKRLVTTHEQPHPPSPAHTHPPQPSRPITRLRPRDHHPKWTDLVGSRCHTACCLSIRAR